MVKAFLSFSILLSFFSCKHAETKKIFYTFPNGQIGEIRYYELDSDTTTFRKEVFYNNGSKGYVGRINKGKKDGEWTWWYPNGMIKDLCKYNNGVYIDTVFHWKENGKLFQIEIVDGHNVLENECCNCNGTIIRYYENGTKKEQFTNIHDQFEGPSYYWDSLGNLISTTFYKNNKAVSPQ